MQSVWQRTTVELQASKDHCIVMKNAEIKETIFMTLVNSAFFFYLTASLPDFLPC